MEVPLGVHEEAEVVKDAEGRQRCREPGEEASRAAFECISWAGVGDLAGDGVGEGKSYIVVKDGTNTS